MTSFMRGQHSDDTAETLNRGRNRLRDHNVQHSELRAGLNRLLESTPELWELIHNLVGINGWIWHEYRRCAHCDQDRRLDLLKKVTFSLYEHEPVYRIWPVKTTSIHGLFDLRKVIAKRPIQVIQAFRDRPARHARSPSKLIDRERQYATLEPLIARDHLGEARFKN